MPTALTVRSLRLTDQLTVGSARAAGSPMQHPRY